MPSRMDKYKDNDNVIATTRSQKNEDLYNEISSNKRYTEFSGFDKDNVVDITNSFGKMDNRRSDFRRKRVLYEDGFISSKEIDNVDQIISNAKVEDEHINYNINDVLEIARKNRNDNTEEEKIRKQKSVEYSILSDLSQEKLKEYRAKKEKPLSKDDEENLEELINTITSSKLRNDIDGELLSDLLPTDDEEPVISQDFLSELEVNLNTEEENSDKDKSDDLESTFEKGLDKSFFTKSMDLKKEDILSEAAVKDNNIDDEIDESFREDGKTNAGKVILIIFLVLLVLGAIGYVIFKFI